MTISKHFKDTKIQRKRNVVGISKFTIVHSFQPHINMRSPDSPMLGGHFSSAASSTSSFGTYSGIVVMTSLCKYLRAQSSFNRIADRVQSSFNLKAGRVQSSFNLIADRVQSSFNLKANRHGYTDHLLVHCHC